MNHLNNIGEEYRLVYNNEMYKSLMKYKRYYETFKYNGSFEKINDIIKDFDDAHNITELLGDCSTSIIDHFDGTEVLLLDRELSMFIDLIRHLADTICKYNYLNKQCGNIIHEIEKLGDNIKSLNESIDSLFDYTVNIMNIIFHPFETRRRKIALSMLVDKKEKLLKTIISKRNEYNDIAAKVKSSIDGYSDIYGIINKFKKESYIDESYDSLFDVSFYKLYNKNTDHVEKSKEISNDLHIPWSDIEYVDIVRNKIKIINNDKSKIIYIKYSDDEHKYVFDRDSNSNRTYKLYSKLYLSGGD